ncbi:hypothetical protein NLU13_7528 [Sarocladium strictum]|uniref:Uncharacterized protein n=1 Tax=Sarocladium strictum TaxID=5046 RepID=A0AA39GCZ6_SARSR|nr:hypothetical protein NLU13_7528 [Sarocladium strictum]
MFGTRSRRSPRTTRAPRKTHHHHTTTTTTTTTRAPRRGLFGRRPVRQQRKPTMKDKVAGALTLKAAGTRRQHGTDGRGSTRRRRFF